MNFVYPQFLFALSAIAIPILIHLFNFRRFKKIYFSDIRFLKEIKQKTQSRNRLKHLLVLLTRILAISFLVFAFAQPFLPAENKNSFSGIQAVSVYVDNSFSMENVSKNGILINEAKKIAREIALAYSQTDLFQLLTNDFEGKHQRFVNREDFLTMLDEIKISSSVKMVSAVTARQMDALSKPTGIAGGSEIKNKKSFLISDFQKSISDFEKVKEDTSVKTILLPISSNEENNLYIDSCWFDSPVHQLNQTENIHIRVKNNSANTYESIPIKLFINNQQKSPSSLSIGPNEEKKVSLSYILKETGIQQGRIEITDYPVTYDDKFYFSFRVEKNISIACIKSKTDASPTIQPSEKYIQSLFGKDSLFTLTLLDENKINYSALSDQQMIILCELATISSGLAQELRLFVQNGGSLIVFPGEEADTSSYKRFLSPFGTNFYLKKDTADTKIDWVNFESEIFSDVFEKNTERLDLPIVHSHFIQSHSQKTSEEVLLKMQNKKSFFSKYSYKKGKIYLSTVPLNTGWSNLAKHAIFIPLMYKIAFNSQLANDLFYTVGKNNFITTTTKLTGQNVFKIKGDEFSQLGKGFEIIPESRIIDLQPTIFVHDQIREAGNYDLFAGNERLSGISFNYDRKESALSQYSPDELISMCEKANLKKFSLIDIENKDITKVLSDMSHGKKLWIWCILLVLLFLAAEMTLLRLLK